MAQMRVLERLLVAAVSCQEVVEMVRREGLPEASASLQEIIEWRETGGRRELT